MRAPKHVNLTLGLCLAGGLAAGIALARPASDDPPVAAATADATDTAEASSGGDEFAYEYPSIGDAASSDADGGDQPAGTGPAGTGPAADGGAGPVAQTFAISIADFAFGAPVTVAPGAEIVVTNLDGAPHSVTATDGGFDSGVLGQDESATIVAPTAPGTYAFFCTVHPSMQGELVVA